MSGRDVIFVLGPGRSGTSALTRVLSLCGCTLPGTVLGSATYNQKGSWEPIDAKVLNFDFITRQGLGGHLDPTMRLQGEIVVSESDREEYITKIEAFLHECPPGPVLVIKALAITETWDYWTEAARRAGFLVKAVIPIRHPQEVVASYGLSLERGSVYWLKRFLLAERNSRGSSRVFVEFGNLITDWRGEVARISSALDLKMDVDVRAIDEFLSPELRHNKQSGAIVEVFGYPWMSQVYTILSDAARDLPIDKRVLDEVYDAFCSCERTFRISLDEFRRSIKPESVKQFRDALERETIWKLGNDF